MNLFDITLHSLKRQKTKKLFLSVAMTLSLCTTLVLFTFVKSQALEMEVQFDEFGANIVITPKTDDLTLSYGGVSLTGIVTNIEEIRSEDVPLIYGIPNSKEILAVSPKLIGIGAVRTSTVERDALIIGIDFDEELKIKAWWRVNGRFPQQPDEALVGAVASEVLALDIGDKLNVKGRELRVAGLLDETGSQDDSAIFASMSFVEELLGKEGRVSLIEVSALCSECPIDMLVTQISEVLPNARVQAVQQVIERRSLIVKQFARFALSVFGMLVLLCGLYIFSTITASVVERKKEIGILRAVGFSRASIARVVLTEALLLAIVSGLAGIGITLLFLRYFMMMATGLSSIVYDVPLFFLSVLGLLILALFSAAGPAVKASRIDPASAIGSL